MVIWNLNYHFCHTGCVFLIVSCSNNDRFISIKFKLSSCYLLKSLLTFIIGIWWWWSPSPNFLRWIRGPKSLKRWLSLCYNVLCNLKNYWCWQWQICRGLFKPTWKMFDHDKLICSRIWRICYGEVPNYLQCKNLELITVIFMQYLGW